MPHSVHSGRHHRYGDSPTWRMVQGASKKVRATAPALNALKSVAASPGLTTTLKHRPRCPRKPAALSQCLGTRDELPFACTSFDFTTLFLRGMPYIDSKAFGCQLFQHRLLSGPAFAKQCLLCINSRVT